MNLMKIATGALTPVLANKLAGTLGVPEGIVRKMLSVGLPVVLAAFMKRGASQDGADAIGTAMNGMPDNPLSDLGAALGGDAGSVQKASTAGSSMLASILGKSESSSLVDTLASYVGGDKTAVSGLLGVVGAGALGSLKATATEQGLDTGGVLKLLSSQKDELAAAIPGDFAKSLAGTGLLPDGFEKISATAASAAQAAPAAAAAAATQAGGGMRKWLIGLAAILLLVWIVPQFLGGADDPMVVNGTDIGETMSGALTSLTDTLAGVTDAGSAQSALEGLTSVGSSLSDLQSIVGGMGQEGQSAIAALISGAMPALQPAIDSLLGNAEISAILKPVLDSIMGSLTSMAG